MSQLDWSPTHNFFLPGGPGDIGGGSCSDQGCGCSVYPVDNQTDRANQAFGLVEFVGGVRIMKMSQA